jgi:hypothetical protein
MEKMCDGIHDLRPKADGMGRVCSTDWKDYFEYQGNTKMRFEEMWVWIGFVGFRRGKSGT